MLLCYGIFAKILTFCKHSRGNPTNKEIHEILFSSVCKTYTEIPVGDYTSTHLLKCVQNVPPEVAGDARRLIQKEDTQKVAAYFKSKIIDSHIIKNDERTERGIVGQLLNIIREDVTISENTKVDLVTGRTKKELLTQEIFYFPAFLAGVFLYAVTVDNRKGQRFVAKLNNESFIACVEKSGNIKIVNTLNNLVENTDSKINPSSEFDDIILKNNFVLRESQRKIHVYSWNELDFESVYVIPNLTKKSSYNKRFIFSHRDVFTSKYMFDHLFKQDTFSPAFLGQDFFSQYIFEEVASEYMINNFFYEKGKNYLNVLPKTNFSSNIKRQTTQETSRLDLIKEVFKEDDIIYVVGGAGYGKSLFLKYLCINPQILYEYDEKPLLIIKGDIKRIIKSDGTFRPMTEFLEECFINGSLMKPDEIQPNLILECLQKKRCLILLDALDEVGNDLRQSIHRLIVTYFTKQYPGNKVCITSRERGFIPYEEITWYNIETITACDVEEYIERFIKLNLFDRIEKQGFLRQTRNLIDSKFVNGFLTLSLLLAIYKSDEKLPANKIALYQKCFEYIAFAREQNKKLLINSYTNKRYDWKLLARFMAEATFMELTQLGNNNDDIEENRIEELLSKLYIRTFESVAEFKMSVKMFLQFCSDRTEIFIPSSDKNMYYRFFHRSFYEYFYSKFIVGRTRTVDETYEKLFCFDVDSEVFELTVTLYQQNNPNYLYELIQYAFDCIEKYKYASRKIYARSIDVFIMLMQAIEDRIFLQRFIKFFLENINNISSLPLRTSFGLIYNIFVKDQKYFTEQFYVQSPSLLIKIQKRLDNYLLKDREECNKVLINFDKIYTSFNDIKSQKGIKLPDLLFILPNTYRILIDWMERLGNKYCISPMNILEKDMDDDLCAFANIVLGTSFIKQIDVYNTILKNA